MRGYEGIYVRVWQDVCEGVGMYMCEGLGNMCEV